MKMSGQGNKDLANFNQDIFTLREEVEHEFVLYFASEPKEFYKLPSINLLTEGNEILGCNGAYFND